MATRLEFDESEELADVLARFHDVSLAVGLNDEQRVAGEQFIQTFHPTLVRSVKLGNQARIEKTIGDGKSSIRIVALPKARRSRIRHFLSILLGTNA